MEEYGPEAEEENEELTDALTAPINMGHMLRGFIPTYATEKMERYYRRKKQDRKTCTGTLWGAKWIQFQWEEAHELWKTRCKEVHGDAESYFSRRERKELCIKVKALYQLKDKVNSVTRDLFHTPLEEKLKTNSKRLKVWIATVTPTIKKAVAEAKEKEQQKQTDIRDFVEFVRTREQREAEEDSETDDRGGDT